jgi:hypothetical protein
MTTVKSCEASHQRGISNGTPLRMKRNGAARRSAVICATSTVSGGPHPSENLVTLTPE